jgi:hypothetical protein
VEQPTALVNAGCTLGGVTTADALADLPSGSAAVSIAAAGSTPSGDAFASARAMLQDRFLFSVPEGLLAPGEDLLVDVTFRLHGAVSIGALAAAGGENFLIYSLCISDPSGITAGKFLNRGTIDMETFGETVFTQTVTVKQPFFWTDLFMELWIPGVLEGAVDYGATIEIDVPPGVGWSSESGVLLTAAEPGAGLAGAIAAVAVLAVAPLGRVTRRTRTRRQGKQRHDGAHGRRRLGRVLDPIQVLEVAVRSDTKARDWLVTEERRHRMLPAALDRHDAQ